MTISSLPADTVKLQPASDAANTAARSNTEDDAMIRAAAKLTRDLNAPRPAIYWSDFLASTVIGYAAMAATIFAETSFLAVAAAIISILALYRAGSFIHELTHIKHSVVPGFRLGWNMLIGIPLMVPSFMYEGVHNIHHMRKKYGTVQDPEYLPLALMKPYTVPLFVLISALGPVALLLRYGILAPFSAIFPPLRKIVVERYSGLVINPEFRRRMPEGEQRQRWLALEVATSIWAITLLTLVVTSIIPMKAFLIFLVIASGTVVLNQIRTLVAHLWANDGEEMSVTAQYLDSVNVPPPGLLPALWAPVGLRYHALHHLLPGVPYHALGEAHRRISAELPGQSTFNAASYRSLSGLIGQLVGSTFKRGS